MLSIMSQHQFNVLHRIMRRWLSQGIWQIWQAAFKETLTCWQMAWCAKFVYDGIDLVYVQATWNSVESYANISIGPTIYESSLPALMLGVAFSTSDVVSLWAVFNKTGEVLSAERVSTSSKPIGRM